MHSLIVSLRKLELGDFGDFKVIGRGKYTELRECVKKPYEMKVQALR